MDINRHEISMKGDEMVRLLTMQYTPEIYGVFAKIGFFTPGMGKFISHESFSVAQNLTANGVNSLIERLLSDMVVTIGETEYLIDFSVFEEGYC